MDFNFPVEVQRFINKPSMFELVEGSIFSQTWPITEVTECPNEAFFECLKRCVWAFAGGETAAFRAGRGGSGESIALPLERQLEGPVLLRFGGVASQELSLRNGWHL